jgi:hypothetical protein
MMRRKRCNWFGCTLGEHEPCCERCGAWLYDPDFVPIGSLEWIMDAWAWVRRLPSKAHRRCDVCGGSMWFKPDEPCCSSECLDRWLPF